MKSRSYMIMSNSFTGNETGKTYYFSFIDIDSLQLQLHKLNINAHIVQNIKTLQACIKTIYVGGCRRKMK